MNSRERMIRALERNDLPDRVPIFIEGMMSEFQRNSDELYGDDIEEEDLIIINGDWTWTKYYKFDSQWLHSTPVRLKPLNGIDPTKIDLGNPNRTVGRMGHISEKVRRENKTVGAYQTGYLNTRELWQEWIDAGYFEYEIDNDWIRSWEKAYPKILEKDLILVPVDTFFEKIREAFTFGKFSYFLRKQKPFLKMLIEKMFKIGLEVVKGWCDAGFEIMTLADDTAYKNRVMYSPKLFEELIVPHYKVLNDYIHKQGGLSFYHSDGYTEPYFPGLIDSGFDGHQSLEPLAGMDLKHLKEEYGDRFTLLGNMDVSQSLCFFSQEEVAAATKKCLDDAMEGGGYIFSPATDIIDSCKPESIKTMVSTIQKYGVYE
jgi:Uroporphyrinogen decarboxylase (URO-D)